MAQRPSFLPAVLLWCCLLSAGCDAPMTQIVTQGLGARQTSAGEALLAPARATGLKAPAARAATGTAVPGGTKQAVPAAAPPSSPDANIVSPQAAPRAGLAESVLVSNAPASGTAQAPAAASVSLEAATSGTGSPKTLQNGGPTLDSGNSLISNNGGGIISNNGGGLGGTGKQSNTPPLDPKSSPSPSPSPRL